MRGIPGTLPLVADLQAGGFDVQVSTILTI